MPPRRRGYGLCLLFMVALLFQLLVLAAYSALPSTVPVGMKPIPATLGIFKSPKAPVGLRQSPPAVVASTPELGPTRNALSRRVSGRARLPGAHLSSSQPQGGAIGVRLDGSVADDTAGGSVAPNASEMPSGIETPLWRQVCRCTTNFR